jgi:hypothetical protein
MADQVGVLGFDAELVAARFVLEAGVGLSVVGGGCRQSPTQYPVS